MKKIFTLFSTLLLSIAMFAAPAKPKSMLTIQSLSRGDMKVVIDGRRFEPHDNLMRLQGINAGYHSIKIYRERTGGHFNLFGKRYDMVFNGSVTVRPRTNLTISVDRNGRTTMRETRFNGWNNGRNNRYDDRDGRDGRIYDRNDDRGYDWDDKYDRRHDFDFDNDDRQGDYGWDERGNANDRYASAISDREFSRVMEAISKEWLESNKMKSASQVIHTNFFTSLQVKQMMQLFEMENNKVELAKLAYTKTVDQRNFLATVDDELRFDNSRNELARFIRNSR
jgi:hypothetical protein